MQRFVFVSDRKGVVRTFQETTIFKDMTVTENVVVAHHPRSRGPSFGFFINSPLARREEAEFRESASEIIGFLDLETVRDEPARNPPHGYLRELGK